MAKTKEELKKRKREYNKNYNINNKKDISNNKKEYYQKNKDKIKEHKKEYRMRLDVQIRAKEYRKNNKDKTRGSNKQWKIDNPIYSKQWYQKNRESEIKKGKEHYKKPEVKERKREYGMIYGKTYRKRPEVIVRVKEREKMRWEKRVEIENKKRKKLNLPLVGEGWISENKLLNHIKNLFPTYKITFHCRNWSHTRLELDIYIPKLKLAFEYNGKQHYKWIRFFHKTKADFESQQYRDKIKKRICKQKGITLIRIKYDEELSEQLVLSKLKYFT